MVRGKIVGKLTRKQARKLEEAENHRFFRNYLLDPVLRRQLREAADAELELLQTSTGTAGFSEDQVTTASYESVEITKIEQTTNLNVSQTNNNQTVKSSEDNLQNKGIDINDDNKLD